MQIRHDPRNERACLLRQQLCEQLDPESLPADLTLVLGGDGFLLRCLRQSGHDTTWLGVNCGRLGFMLNDPQPLEVLVESLTRARYAVTTIPRLRLKANRAEGKPIEDLAINDVYLERQSGQTAHLRVSVDGTRVVDRLVCDGVVASTAMGSTAYALAAGGVACHSSLQLIQLVAINPHAPRLPPIALRRDAVIEVEVLDGHRRPVRAVADGHEHPAVRQVEIRDADSDIRLAFFEGHDPTATMVRKMLHPV